MLRFPFPKDSTFERERLLIRHVSATAAVSTREGTPKAWPVYRSTALEGWPSRPRVER